MPKTYLLTKSKYIRGLQCEKAMFLDVYKPKLARYSPETLAKFKQGRAFEKEYKDTFPAGIDVSKRLGWKMDQYPVLTADLLRQEGEVDLFEAGFLYDDVLVLADVVHKQADGKVIVYEVKNSLAVSDTFANDVAIQYYVISHAMGRIGGADLFGEGLRLDQFNLLYHNEEGEFVSEDLTQRAHEMGAGIPERLKHFKDVLRADEPQTEISPHCDIPYECPYKQYCAMLAKD